MLTALVFVSMLHGKPLPAQYRLILKPPVCTRMNPTGRTLKITRPRCAWIRGTYVGLDATRSVCVIEERI